MKSAIGTILVLFAGALSSATLHAQTPILTPSPIPTTACVVCEYREIAKESTRTYMTSEQKTLFSYEEESVDLVERLNGISYQDCKDQDTNGEQVVYDGLSESSDLKRVKQTYQSKISVVSVMNDAYCQKIGRFPPQMWKTCLCFEEETFQRTGGSWEGTDGKIEVVTPRRLIEDAETRYNITNCSHLNKTTTVIKKSGYGIVVRARRRDRYGNMPEEEVRTSRYSRTCQEK
jgi:hypothetical protein